MAFTYQHLVAGTTAGLVSTVTLYPLELVKTRMQVTDRKLVAYQSLPNAFKSVLVKEGYHGFYRGMFPAIIAASGSWGGYFYLYESAKKEKIIKLWSKQT